jgi:hypothetical protein
MTLATAAGAPVIVTPHDVTVLLIPYDASGGDDEVGTAHCDKRTLRGADC